MMSSMGYRLAPSTAEPVCGRKFQGEYAQKGDERNGTMAAFRGKNYLLTADDERMNSKMYEENPSLSNDREYDCAWNDDEADQFGIEEVGPVMSKGNYAVAKDEINVVAHVPFSTRETEMILDRYVEGYETYHHTLTGATRQGVTAKKRFLADLTEEVNAMGVAKRTEKQIDQKIRDEMKVLKRYSNALKAEREKTGGGRPLLPRLSAAQMKAFEALEMKPRVSGIPAGTEVGMKTDDRPEASDVAVKAMKRRRQPELDNSPSSSSEQHPPERCGLKKRAVSPNDVLMMEVENLELRREALAKKNRLLDLQIMYWTRKINHQL